MTNLPTWLVVVLTLAPSILTVSGVLFTLRYNARSEKERAKREHATWLRERRYEAFAVLMDSAYAFSVAAIREKGANEHYVESARQVALATERVRLLVNVEDGKTLARRTQALYKVSETHPDDVDAQGKVLRELRLFAVDQVHEYDGT